MTDPVVFRDGAWWYGSHGPYLDESAARQAQEIAEPFRGMFDVTYARVSKTGSGLEPRPGANKA